MMHRRSFIQSSIGFSLIFPSFVEAANLPFLDQIGLQLYTLRKPISEDLGRTLNEVSSIGYKQVEPYGFPSPEALEMIKKARDLGMSVHSTHFAWDSLLHPEKKNQPTFEKIIELAEKLEITDLVIPYIHEVDRSDLSAYERTAETLNQGAILSKEAGIRLAYHNHAFEFKPLTFGKTGYDVFVESFSPEMFFEVDVFWVKVGGVDPIAQLKKLKGRVSQVHLKDLSKRVHCPNFGKMSPDDFEEIGDGQIPMIPIIKTAKACGVKHCHIEQDHSPDPIASIHKSLRHLKK